MKNSNYFIEDLVSIFLEKIETTSQEFNSCDEQTEIEYLKGQIFAYYDILDTIKSQAVSFDFDIPLLSNINLEKYLSK